MALAWLDTREATAFAQSLAAFLAEELGRFQSKNYQQKAAKTLVKAARRVEEFKATHRLNFWKRSRLANTFLWSLRDSGCPKDYADELTRWLARQL